jgi:asparagine synthase (glutamine-hydrolysing)
VTAQGIVQEEQYWDVARAAEGLERGEHDSVKVVRQHLERSVREHLLSDVPVASFLSGGTDSAVVTALAAQQSAQKLRTFTVGFEDSALDERRHAAEVAKRWGTEHHEVMLNDAEAAVLVPSGMDAMDQPSADALNTYIVSRAAARSGSKVVLSGLGADELFGGYRSFRVLPLARRWAKALPWLSHSRPLARFVPGGERGLEMLRNDATLAMRYESLRSYWSWNELRAMRVKAPALEESEPHVNALNARIGVLELDHYMRNVLLRDSDAMSMAHSVELRVPFLDHELAAYVIANGLAGRGRKLALIAACQDLLPAESRGRPKQGFVLPMQRWMSGALKEYQADGLAALARSGALPHVPVKQLEEQFANGKLHWSRLWQFVVLGHWMKDVLDGGAAIADHIESSSSVMVTQ